MSNKLTSTFIGDTIQDYLDGDGYTINNQSLEHWESLIKEYARQKCKEQRELCSSAFDELAYYPSANDAILNAPEPKFD